LDEINLFDHPFKRELAARMAGKSHGFDHSYFDDPEAVSGFRGYHEGGNAAEGAREFRKEAHDLVDAIASAGPRPPGVRGVLDVGCAKGFLVRHLRHLGVDAWGCDISDYAIANAAEEVRPYVWVSTVSDLDPNQRYQLVHVHGVLIYLDLSEIRRVLRRIHDMCTFGLASYEPTRELFERCYEARDEGAFDPLRKQELTSAQWAGLMEEAGFRREGAIWRR
jgi:SAM-dependent methyltransferase